MCLLIFIGWVMASNLFAQETISVNATGVGATAEAAEKAALVNAVQQAVGLYLDSETLVKNEQVVYDSILSLSDGFVTKYDVKASPRKRLSDGLFEISISAVVQQGKVGAELQRRNLVQRVDSRDAWAEAVTTVKSAQDAVEILKHRVPAMVAALITARLIEGNGSPAKQPRPEVKPDPSTGHAWCAWNIEVGYDRDAYYTKAVPLLQKAFNAVADRPLPDFTIKAPASAQLNVSSREPDYNMRHTAILGSPARFPGRMDFAWPKLENRDDIVVCLNYSSDKSRQNLRFHAWVLNRGLYEKWLQSLFMPRALKAAFLDERGEVVIDDVIQLWKGTLLAPTAYDQGARQGMMGPKAVQAKIFESPLGYWGTTNDWSNAPVLWITPDFRTKSDVSLAGNWVHLAPYLDSLLIHHEISLDPDDIKKLKAVRFSVVPGQTEY